MIKISALSPCVLLNGTCLNLLQLFLKVLWRLDANPALASAQKPDKTSQKSCRDFPWIQLIKDSVHGVFIHRKGHSCRRMLIIIYISVAILYFSYLFWLTEAIKEQNDTEKINIGDSASFHWPELCR